MKKQNMSGMGVYIRFFDFFLFLLLSHCVLCRTQYRAVGTQYRTVGTYAVPYVLAQVPGPGPGPGPNMHIPSIHIYIYICYF